MTYPKRIISLVPSQTELLHYLGLDQRVVGITKFCVHPKGWYKHKTKVGGTKTVHLEKVAALNPDLIIGNKEENTKEQIEALQKQYPVWISDIKTLDDALEMIVVLGEMLGKSKKATELADTIEARFFSLKKSKSKEAKTTAAYIIWRKPYMVAASDTFIDAMLTWAGFENIFSDKKRYPEIRIADLIARQPNSILLSSEPFPFKEKHIAELQEACPQSEIKLVDGELFSWYGNRLLESAAYFDSL